MNIPTVIGEAAPPSTQRVEATVKRVQESNLSPFEKTRAIQNLQDLQIEGVQEFEIPEETKEVLRVANKLAGEMVELEVRRPELRKKIYRYTGNYKSRNGKRN